MFTRLVRFTLAPGSETKAQELADELTPLIVKQPGCRLSRCLGTPVTASTGFRYGRRLGAPQARQASRGERHSAAGAEAVRRSPIGVGAAARPPRCRWACSGGRSELPHTERVRPVPHPRRSGVNLGSQRLVNR
jgi:hypothetical protein